MNPTGTPGSRTAARTEAPTLRGLGPRIIIISALFAPACVWWARDQTVDRIFSLMIPPVVLTLILVACNAPLRRYAPRIALTTAELVLFYAFQAILCAVASEWLDNSFNYSYSYALFGAGDSAVEKGIIPHAPGMLFFLQKDGLETFGGGGRSVAFALSRWQLWLPKIGAWTLLLGLVCLAMLCINSLMREQWTTRERLAFPTLQVPIAITQDGGGGPVWRSPWMWGAFGVMLAIDLLNGFSFWFPSLPSINVRYLGDMGRWFNSPPWNGIGWTPIGIFPYLSAIGLFMPTDLLFSCVVFFFVRKAQQVLLTSMGYEQGMFGGGGLLPSPPYASEQSWGAFIGLAVAAAWSARAYLRTVAREIRHGGSGDRRLVPHRFAFAGLLLSLGGLGAFGVLAGLPFGFTLGYAAVFLIFSVALTRLRAQLGPPLNEMAFMGPNQLIVDLRGTEGVPASLIARWVTTLNFMNRIHRTHPMPHQLESLKLADQHGASQRGMFVAILSATLIGIALGAVVQVCLGYRYGATNAAWDTPGMVSDLVNTPRRPNIAAITAIVAGFGVVMGLDAVRFRIPGFALHPAGYALSMNFGIDYIWFGLIIVLAAKYCVQRYMGIRGYDRLRMIAIGIILAEYIAEGAFSTVAMVTREATYSVSINGRLIWDQ